MATILNVGTKQGLEVEEEENGASASSTPVHTPLHSESVTKAKAKVAAEQQHGMKQLVSIEAEEYAHHPKHQPLCVRLRKELQVKNLNFSVWTTLGRLEWIEAFGRGGNGFRGELTPLSPGTIRWIRLLLFLACAGILLPTWILFWQDGESMYFLTTWTNFFIFAYFAFSTYVTFWLHGQDKLSKSIPFVARVTWYLHCVALPLSNVVLVLFWIFISFDPSYSFNIFDLLNHGGTFLLIWIDFYLGAQPYLIAHSIYSLLFIATFLIWSGVHFLLRLGPEHADGEIYIYQPMNWRFPIFTTLVTVIPTLVGTLISCFICWLIGRDRDVPYTHYQSTLRI